MEKQLQQIIYQAALKAFENGLLPETPSETVNIEVPRIKAHGDFSTNYAMTMAKSQKKAPRAIAEALLANIVVGDGTIIERVELAGAGFINFFMQHSAWTPCITTALTAGAAYGENVLGGNSRVQVEFVSANPTGPLHIGHGRGAAVGDAVSSLLKACGYNVEREYYINDSGRQIGTLGRSVYLRMQEAQGQPVDFPGDCYQGDYIKDIASALYAQEGPALLQKPEEEAVTACARYAAGIILDGIKDDLAAFNIYFDNYFSEQSLYDSGRVDAVLKLLEEKGIAYREEGALWAKTTLFGDEKDRVIIRANGLTTYFASDVAYSQEKFERGFDRVINVMGADHHGYIPRLKAGVEMLGYDSAKTDAILVQMVNLLRNGKPVAMSTRSGEFETLRSVIDEVGTDAARFIFLTRSYDSPLDFDLDVAKKQSNENPVYYVQYVHARICSILQKAREAGIDEFATDAGLAKLTSAEEMDLIKAIQAYPGVVAEAGTALAPHRLTHFLMEFAAAFHSFYNVHRVLDEDREVSLGRLNLVKAVRQVIKNGLALLGVNAPEKM